MEAIAYAMAGKVANHGIAIVMRVFHDGRADITDMPPWPIASMPICRHSFVTSTSRLLPRSPRRS